MDCVAETGKMRSCRNCNCVLSASLFVTSRMAFWASTGAVIRQSLRSIFVARCVVTCVRCSRRIFETHCAEI